MGRTTQTAPPHTELCETITISMAVHPLRGVPLPLVRKHRWAGLPYFEAEHPMGWRIMVPLSWTDQAVSPVPARAPSGAPIRVSAAALQALAAAVEVISRVSLDDRQATGEGSDPADPSTLVVDAAPSFAANLESTALGGAVTPGAQRPGRVVVGARVGGPGPAGTSRDGGNR